MTIKITLTHGEIVAAGAVGVARQAASRNSRSAHGLDESATSGMGYAIEGACAELACAKALNLYWPATVNTFSGPDIGETIQVRRRLNLPGKRDLYVRPNDDEKYAYFLVWGLCPNFEIVGYIWGKNAKIEKYYVDTKTRPPAWFIPPDDLHPVERCVRPMVEHD
jgi:hypothetical protein